MTITRQRPVIAAASTQMMREFFPLWGANVWTVNETTQYDDKFSVSDLLWLITSPYRLHDDPNVLRWCVVLAETLPEAVEQMRAELEGKESHVTRQSA